MSHRLTTGIDQVHNDDGTQCNLAWIIKDHMKLLMKTFRKELAEYSMQDVDTKCLNTAVMMMYLLLGKDALEHTRYCDVSNVKERARSDPEGFSSVKLVQRLRRLLMRKAINQKGNLMPRELYYIMMTNYDKDEFFPGHVFVIERAPTRNTSTPVRYYVYQSYINKYNLKTFFEMNRNTFEVSPSRMQAFADGFVEFFKSEKWTDASVAFWKAFTGTDDGEGLRGTVKGNRTFLCFRMVKVKHCARVLVKQLQQKQKEKGREEDEEVKQVQEVIERLNTRSRAG